MAADLRPIRSVWPGRKRLASRAHGNGSCDCGDRGGSNDCDAEAVSYTHLYFNKKMEVAFPHLETGMLCYQALRGEPASCPDCTLILDHASKSRVYNQRIRSWIETEVSDIDWPLSLIHI